MKVHRFISHSVFMFSSQVDTLYSPKHYQLNGFIIKTKFVYSELDTKIFVLGTDGDWGLIPDRYV